MFPSHVCVIQKKNRLGTGLIFLCTVIFGAGLNWYNGKLVISACY